MTLPTDDRGSIRSVLEEERDFFLRSLRDLEVEHGAGDIDDVDYRSLRDDYTARAAEVVRRLAALDRPPGGLGTAASVDGAVSGSVDGAVSDPLVAPPPAPGRPSRRRRRIVTGVVALVVVGAAIGGVVGLSGSSQSSTTRVRDLDVAALDALGNNQYEKAVQDYEAALKIAPSDVETLTGEGELLSEIGSHGDSATLDLGMSRLQSAEIVSPTYGPAFGARGIGFYDEGNYAAAVPQLEAYLADTPKASQSAAIRQTLVAAQRKLAAKGS